MYPVKQSTTLTVPVFAHDANGDKVTGLSNASFTKRISKGSGAFAAMTVTLAEKENGWYDVPLTAAHTNTLGLLTITLTNAGAKQINLQFRVEAKLTDDLNDIAATAIVSSGAITTLAGAVANVDLVDVTTTNTDMRGTNSAATATSLANAQSDLDIITGADGVNLLSATQASIDFIEADTGELQTDWANGGRLDLILDAISVDAASGGIVKNSPHSNFEFPMRLASDHYTAATGVTVTGERSIDGGAFAAVSGAIAEVGSGIYQIDLLAADTNGDTITYKFSSATADDTVITVITRA